MQITVGGEQNSMEDKLSKLKLMYGGAVSEVAKGEIYEVNLEYKRLLVYKVRNIVEHSIILEYDNSGKTSSKYIIWNVDNDREFRSEVSINFNPIVKTHKNIIVASLSSRSILVLNADLDIIFNYKTDKSILSINRLEENDGKLEIWIKEQSMCFDKSNGLWMRTESKKLEVDIIGA